MSKSLDVSILVRLVDRVTAPLNALQRSFAKLAGVAGRIGALGTAVAAISFAGPIQSAAAFDQVLRDSVVTAGLFGQEAEQRITALAAKFQELALQVGITSEELAKSGGLLIAAGMDEKQVERLMPVIGRVAKASSAAANDVAKVGFAFSNTLGITADKMEEAFAKAIVAGKLGRFEFKDMARELPELTAQYAKFGITGMKAVESIGAALQVAMFGTDSTSTAANNFKNFLSKLLSPETRKNFEKMGVDIAGVMKDAAAKGIDPIEAAIQKVVKLTGVSQEQIVSFYNAHKAAGKSDAEATAAAIEQIKRIGGAEKLGALFGDMQVLDFMLPMLANIQKYLDFRKEIQASGLEVIQRDFATQMAGLSTQWALIAEIGTQFTRRVGLAFGRNLGWINQGLWGLLGWINRIDKAFPGAIDMVLTIGGGFLVLVAALGLLGPVFSIVSAGFGVLAAVVGALFAPIGLLAAALAAAAVIIYSDWANFAPFFQRIWTGVIEAATGFVTLFKALWRGDWSGAFAAARAILTAFGEIRGGLLSVLLRLGSVVIDWLDNQLGTDIRNWPGKVAAELSAAAETVTAVLRAAWEGAGRTLQFVWDTNLRQIREAFDGFARWIDGWTGGAFSTALAKVGEAWTKLKTDAAAAFGEIKALWQSVVDYIAAHIPKIPSWSDVGKYFGGGDTPQPSAGGAAPATDAMGNPTGGYSPAPGYAPTSGKQSAAQPITGSIVVSAAEGARITNVQSDNPSVPLVADRGTVVGRA
ncbi:phage tail tape measure protein [Azorhizobium caulinodans]|uniref:phage tail tape measure protein n=1 Tax=Azorhizobium caulinodans TaxID=7 RepID=UPI002FBEEF7B